jgi:hypothetical protein
MISSSGANSVCSRARKEEQMFVVYWLDGGGAEPQPGFQTFGAEEMSEALKFMEGLREQQRNGARNVAFITMCSENPNAVGKAGAADPAADYNWTKRRGNMPRARIDLQKKNYETD